MKIRTAIVAATLLLGGAATTFAGERRTADVRDRGDHREVVVRHDDDHRDVRQDRDFGYDRDSHHDRDVVVRQAPGCTVVFDRR